MQPITVQIGPNQWELTYTFADFAEAERRLKRPLLFGSQKSVAEWEAMTATEDLAVSLFIGVCRKNRPLTLENCYDAISYENMIDVQNKVAEALQRDTKPLRERAARDESAPNPTVTT